MTRPPRRKAPIRTWASGRLSDEIQRALDRLARSDDVQRIAVMPDVHLASEVCVGTVFATSELLYPQAVGGDIGCGMAAVALDASCQSLDQSDHRDRFLRTLRQVVPIQRQRAVNMRPLAGMLPDPEKLSIPTLTDLALNEGVMQLGTVGTGNHFLELQHDEDDRLWLMVHSGSRAMGQAIKTAHLENAVKSCSGLKYLSSKTSAGQAYLQDLQWARQFAKANRRCMLLAAVKVAHSQLGSSLVGETWQDCDHNHINAETHQGSTWYVHRKGAIAAFRDQSGLIPGSMATASFHVLGRGAAGSICSSAHGAGRIMSRSEARARISRHRLASELSSVHVDQRMLSGLREEAPSAYKDIHAVMKDQRKLVRVVRTLNPILTHKGVIST